MRHRGDTKETPRRHKGDSKGDTWETQRGQQRRHLGDTKETQRGRKGDSKETQRRRKGDTKETLRRQKQTKAVPHVCHCVLACGGPARAFRWLTRTTVSQLASCLASCAAAAS